MNVAMSFLPVAFATVLAPLALGQSTPPQPKITGVLTILTPKPGVTVEQVMKIMPAEIRATVPLYLDGKIQQWFTRGDGKGVIFISHNLQDIFAVSDRIVVLRRGIQAGERKISETNHDEVVKLMVGG